MSCDEIKSVLAGVSFCVETEQGTRVTTHCLYPSFEPVNVFVAKMGDGFKVHDGAGAFDAAWLHGRDGRVINNAIATECARFQLLLSDNSIVGSVASIEWLPNVILSVANASSFAAHRAVARLVAAAEDALVVKIDRALTDRFGVDSFRRRVELTGNSGGKRHFDFALPALHGDAILISGVSSHMGSVSSKFVSFSDTNGDRDHKLAVFDHELAPDEAALLGQVASVVPLASLPPFAERALSHSH
jgi:hypothetical protein